MGSRAHAGANRIGCAKGRLYDLGRACRDRAAYIQRRAGDRRWLLVLALLDWPTSPGLINREKSGRTPDMAIGFAGPRHARFLLALLAFSLVAGARAEDAADPPQSQPAATPSGQKSPATGGRGGNIQNPPVSAEQHRLPPDSTTKQTLALPGRTLAFTATAGSIHLFNDKGEPQADIAYTFLSTGWRRRAHPPRDFLLQWRAGCGLRLPA